MTSCGSVIRITFYWLVHLGTLTNKNLCMDLYTYPVGDDVQTIPPSVRFTVSSCTGNPLQLRIPAIPVATVTIGYPLHLRVAEPRTICA